MALDKSATVKITNRSYGTVVYRIADLNLRREYQPGETKEITVEEIMKLSSSAGGRKLLEKYLIVDDEAVVQEILGTVEPEYFYTEEDIKNLLLNGTLDELDDCLTFGGESVQDITKKIAVEIELNDVKKRELIQEKTGYNITSMIGFNKETEEDNQKEEKPQRKARTASKYKVISTTEQ